MHPFQTVRRISSELNEVDLCMLMFVCVCVRVCVCVFVWILYMRNERKWCRECVAKCSRIAWCLCCTLNTHALISMCWTHNASVFMHSYCLTCIDWWRWMKKCLSWKATVVERSDETRWNVILSMLWLWLCTQAISDRINTVNSWCSIYTRIQQIYRLTII